MSSRYKEWLILELMTKPAINHCTKCGFDLKISLRRATETEFNILQHGFGLEKLFVKDPIKVWPLFLISLICKTILELILKAIHSVHGGYLDMASFKVNLGIILEHIASGRSTQLPLTPCDSPLCPYRRKRGLRKL